MYDVKDHFEEGSRRFCNSCGVEFKPDQVVLEVEVNGVKRFFCDDSCYNDFVSVELLLDDEDL